MGVVKMSAQTAAMKASQMDRQLLHQVRRYTHGTRVTVTGGDAIYDALFAPQILHKASAGSDALAGALILGQLRLGALGDGDNILDANRCVAEDHGFVWARSFH